MLLNRHRIAKLIELTDLERRLTGPERMLREEDVALLVKAAYDDATDAARAAFMARVQSMPVTTWPWSAVQVKAARSGVVAGPGGRVTMGLSSTPVPVIPPALLLIRGEAESTDAEPGDRLPERGAPEAAVWEPLHQALDRWDTQTIARWIGPQGWISPGGAAAGQPAQNTDDGATSGQSAGGSPGGGSTLPAPQPPAASTFSWRSPAVIAVGTTVASTVGVVLFSLRRRRASVAPQQETP